MLDKNDPQLTAYAMDALPADQAAVVEQALAQSPELTAVVNEIRMTVGLLEDAFADEPKLELSEDQKSALKSAAQSVAQSAAQSTDQPTAAVGSTDDGPTVWANVSRIDTKPQSTQPTHASRPWKRWLLAAAIGGVLIAGSAWMVNPDALSPRLTAIHDRADSEPVSGQAPNLKDGKRSNDKSSQVVTAQSQAIPAAASATKSSKPEGITVKDFGPLTDLIQSTIESEKGLENTESFTPPPSLSLNVQNSQQVVDEFAEGKEIASQQPDLGGQTGNRMSRGGGIGGGGGRGRFDDASGFGSKKMNDIPSIMPSSPTPPDAAEGDLEELGKMRGLIEFPPADQWLNKKSHRNRFSNGRLSDRSGENESLLVPSPADGLSKRPAEFIAGGEIPLAGSRTRSATEGRKFDDSKSFQFDKGGDTGRSHQGLKGKDGKSQSPARAAKPTPKKKKTAKSWKRVKAIPNTTRLMVGDKEELDLTGMQVNVQIDGFRARVLIDYLYYNDRDQRLEGNFKLRLPEDSSLYYFAFGESANELTPQRRLARREFIDNGTQFISFNPVEVSKSRTDVWRNVKEARMVPREQAAYAYRETVRRRVDPALVEWSGAGVFSAKVFPLAPRKVHRIVVGYDVNLTRIGNDLTYQLDLPETSGDCRVEINAQDVEGITYAIQPAAEPVEVDHNDELHLRYTYDSRPENGIQFKATTDAALLLKSKELDGEFWSTQITPELPVEQSTSHSRALFMLDTSLSSSPDKFNVWLKLLETTLTNNRDSMREFGVLMFSVDTQFWQPRYVANNEENVQSLIATLNNVVLEGATDLYAALDKIATTDWVTGGEAPDLFLLSDGNANWGETNLRLMGKLLDSTTTGGLFAYQTGLTGTAIGNLRFLAGETGGAVFSVASEAEIQTVSTAHRNRPWRLKNITAAGASDVMTAGRVQWVYPGQTLTVVGRGAVTGGVEIAFEQAGKTPTTIKTNVAPIEIMSELTGRMYGQVSVGQLESLGSELFDISAAYARHFRVTGDTCSLLMLESEADYERFEIKPQEDEFVIKSKQASVLVSQMLAKAADRLDDPKAQLLTWLKRLETMQGMKFQMPTALKLAMEDIQVVAISQPLECTLMTRSDVSKGYLSALQKENLDYDVIAGQAKKRGRKSIDDSIKVFSSLIERNPGNVTIARDVAFTALELDRPAQAYHLLRSVAQRRPFQGNIYPAIGQCLAQMGQSDMAIVYYEVALAGEFQRQGSNFDQIVAVDYMHLLRQIVKGKAKSSVKDFAQARLETLVKNMPVSKADVLVTMMWNQDQTDVDLHVIEPSGEECYYSHKKTKSGGQITDDITTGFGPEMYYNPTAPDGKYKIAVKFFGSVQNRASVKNKVYLSVFEDFGSENENVTRRTIRLKDAGEHRTVMELEKVAK